VLHGAEMKLLPAVAGVVAFASLASAQSALKFDVASVKPAPKGLPRSTMDGGPLPAGPFNLSGHDPGRITWTNVRLMRMIQVAYDSPVDQISGPPWLDSEGYNIVAALPGTTSASDFRVMVQNLLVERFKLAIHRETKQVSGYALEIAKNGLKIKPSTGAETTPSNEPCKVCNALIVVDQSGFPAPRPGNPYFLPGARFEAAIPVDGKYRVSVLNAPMPEIAAYLGRFAGSPAEDQTGLTGKYDAHVEFVPPPSGAAAAGDNTAADPGADLFGAVQSQLGLKLAPKKVPVEMLVVDHAEKIPTEN
jgi:uncharacterized protein (TIGR03435 family)